MGYWTLDDIAWNRFDHDKVEPLIVPIIKAASLVEFNGGAYAHHLCRIFADDREFQTAARRWGADEIRHGQALGRWAALADPTFDFAAAFARFQEGYQVDFDLGYSRRGSRAGEMVARCMVEVGTSAHYAALRDATLEPVLHQICRKIAADEVRHYKLFYRNLGRCLESERIGFWRRLAIALRRIAETEDDELAYAYYAANEAGLAYDRRRCHRAYARRAYALCRAPHVAHGVAMICKAVGLSPHGPVSRAAGRLAWALLRRRAASLARTAA
jgi:Fatty acid desaturase